ncbi:MAG: DUF3370 family protein [Candidatus Sericytochromatia bacterium]|nr:DUF3370 family protein [Candidatus Sericytochromatia bacterium]
MTVRPPGHLSRAARPRGEAENRWPCLWWLLVVGVLAAGCAAPAVPAPPPAGAAGEGASPPTGLPNPGSAPPTPERSSLRAIRPLPGGLDDVPVLNVNNPELLRRGGVLASTLAGGGANLDFAFTGPFELFWHHIAETAFLDGNDAAWLALIAENDGATPVGLRRVAGASWLTTEAPFVDLESRVEDPRGTVFAGPGSRVAVDWLLGRSSVPPASWTLAPGARDVLFSEPIPAKTLGLPTRNARSGLYRFQGDGAVRLAAVALFGRAGSRPSDEAFLAVLREGQRAGPPERQATVYPPGAPPAGGSFTYGRVSGVSLGARWAGQLFERASVALPDAGDWVGFPIASVAQNTLGTAQIQAPRMARRYPDVPPEAHGSYGVTYDLRIPLDNPGSTPRQYALALSHPVRIPEGKPAAPSYAVTPGPLTTFRGPVRFDWDEGPGQPRRLLTHLVLRQGEQGAPFATVTVPPGWRTDGRLTLVYPADCTPPQLLTVTRL